MKRLVYTAVFDGYDRVYPPVTREDGVDYVLVTDDPALQVAGWTTLHADPDRYGGSKAANRFHKMLIHRVLPGYDASLYVDGNIRLLGPNLVLFEELLQSGAALATFRHPQRDNVAAEVEALIATGKSRDPDAIRGELDDYVADGFTDEVPLRENTIILRNHAHERLDPAMELWWTCFARYNSRDQVSLPYVIWKTGLPVHDLPGTFREPNPWFALYPHMAASHVNPRYAHLAARAHDSAFHKALLAAWELWWKLRRALRG